MKNIKFNKNQLEVYKIIGEKISSKRKKKRKKLPGISKKLNISIDHLNLIEEGDVSNLPKYILVNGFIRTYAKFIGADLTDEFYQLKNKKYKGELEDATIICKKVSYKQLIIFVCIFFSLLIFFYYI
tara:strand:- start:343 stop:723 length:381 start_codon:yes stop_codon:yes gene_type:complete